jgi:Mor family transcriptional regulator
MRLNTDINNSKINITECNKENIETADETKKSEIIKSEYSKEIEEKCCELFKSGTSLRQITKDLNLPKRKVKEFIDNNNIKIPTNKDRYNEEFLNTLIKEYDEGLSIEKLSKKYSCSSNIINKKFKELGVEQRSIYDRNRKYKINHNVFDNIDSEIKAYYLGLFVTDGSMSSKGADISIRLIYSDLEILQRLSYLFYDCDRAFIYDAKDGSNPTAKLYVSSTPIKQKLIELGITPNKTFTTHYLPCITEEYHRHFIRGLIDGDGYLGLRKEMNGAAIILTGTQALLSRVGEILKQKLNIKFRLKKDTNKNTFSLNITHYGDVKTVCNWLYEGSTIYLKRKFNNYQEICIKYYELYGTKYSKEQFKDIKQMYVNNVDIKTISSKMNISEAIVIRILKRERVIDDTELEVTQSDDT